LRIIIFLSPIISGKIDRNKKSRSHYETGIRILTPFILPGLKGKGLKLFNHIKHFSYLAVNVVRCQDRKNKKLGMLWGKEILFFA